MDGDSSNKSIVLSNFRGRRCNNCHGGSNSPNSGGSNNNKVPLPGPAPLVSTFLLLLLLLLPPGHLVLIPWACTYRPVSM